MPELDGLRGLAILMVLAWHYVSLQVTDLENPRLILLHESLSLTWSGVDLFFVLSGFLITGILLKARSTENYWLDFYVRRSCRVLPLYCILLMLYGAALWLQYDKRPEYDWLFGNPMPFWSYATFTQNLFMGFRHAFGANFLSVTWSLAVEEQFYLFIPPLVYWVSRRRLPVVFAVGCLVPMVCRFCFPGYSVLMATPFKLDPLCWGALVALIYHNPTALKLAKDRMREIGLLFLLLVIFSIALTFHLGPLSTIFILFGSFSSVTFGVVALLYATLLLLILLRPESPVFQLLRWQWLVWLGNVSYFVYLFHQVISGVLHLVNGAYKPSANTWTGVALTLASLIVTLVVAEVSRRYFEKPILAWGRSVTVCRAATR